MMLGRVVVLRPGWDDSRVEHKVAQEEGTL